MDERMKRAMGAMEKKSHPVKRWVFARVIMPLACKCIRLVMRNGADLGLRTVHQDSLMLAYCDLKHNILKPDPRGRIMWSA